MELENDLAANDMLIVIVRPTPGPSPSPRQVRSQVARLHSLGNIHKITELASTDLTKIVCRFFLILQGYPSNKFLIIVLSTLTSVSSQTCVQKRSILYCEDACTRIIMRSQAIFFYLFAINGGRSFKLAPLLCARAYSIHFALHDKLFSKFVIKLGDQCYRIRNVWHEVRRVKVDLYSSTSGDNANL